MSREGERSETSVGASGGAASREGAPSDLLDAHPETAYFWGRVIGDGEVTAESVTVRTTDGIAAERLAAIAGGEDDQREASENASGDAASSTSVDHRITEREYAHDASITRREDAYTVRIHGPVGDRAAAALGLPFEGDPGGYRLDTLAGYDRQLLRGLLEGCGTVCFKSSSGTVGISFVADDRRLLERIAGLLDAADVDAPFGEISETSSGGYWFGIDDEAAPDVGAWLYRGSEETGLFAPSRRRKLQRSIEEAEAY
ncbi:cobalamin biosynthesis protein [Natronomonas sp.]|uniref:cobalamin biosynthesis protein n=1 Tax=Natronomonas sp. TaxID=2184060 RepID=UPI003976092F